MMDGSLKTDGNTPAGWEYNVAVTTPCRRYRASRRRLGRGRTWRARIFRERLRRQEDGHGANGKLSHDQLLTNPDEAVEFVRETKVDALAIAMGTSHGAYKFSRKPTGDILR